MKPALYPLEGERIILEPFVERFISDEYISWLTDEETIRWLVKAGSRIDRVEVEKFCRSMIVSADDCFFAIVLRQKEKHIGNVRIGTVDWTSRTTRFGMMIGDASARGCGFGTDVMALVEDFAFGTLGLQTMRFPVVEDHRAAMRMYEKRHFAVDGYWSEDFVRDGTAHRMVAMTKFNPKFAA